MQSCALVLPLFNILLIFSLLLNLEVLKIFFFYRYCHYAAVYFQLFSPCCIPVLLILLLYFPLTNVCLWYYMQHLFNQLIFQRLLILGQVPISFHKKPLGIAGARFFTGWMPFLSPRQQCQSTKGIQSTDSLCKMARMRIFNSFSDSYFFAIFVQ